MCQHLEMAGNNTTSDSVPAVVVGLKENGLGVMRDLGRGGVRVIAVDDNSGNPHFYSKHCSRYVVSPLHGEGLIQSLVEIATEEACRPVLILTMDKSVLTVSPETGWLSDYYRHGFPSDSVIQMLIDKKSISEHANDIGFLVPKTLAPNDLQSFESALGEVPPPYIIKPKTKKPEQIARNPGKAFLVESEEAARDIYRRVYHNDSEVVVQQWIPGPDSNLVFGIFFLDKDSEIVSAFCGRKMRQYKPYVGIAASAEPWNDPRAMRMAKRFFSESRYSGLCAIEFKIDSRDGNYYLIEPTVGRSEHLNALATANGVPVTLNAYQALAGLPSTPVFARPTPVIYVSPLSDMLSAFRYISDGVERPLNWLRSISRRTMYPLWSIEDPAPFFRSQAAFIARKWKGGVRRLRGILRPAKTRSNQ